ncbi:hypothetical protein BGZ73_004041 [Actinomortierella ambigua]|nr:hypothetical protein BGZ73_004041 [Actinomortierella ambigua]
MQHPSQQLLPSIISRRLRHLSPRSHFRERHVSSVSNTNRTRRPWQPENDVKLLELRRQGCSWKAIGQFFGRSQQVVKRRFNSVLGLETYGRHGLSSPKAIAKQMAILKIWIYEQGMSWEQAALLLDTKASVLQHRVQMFDKEQDNCQDLLQKERESSQDLSDVTGKREDRQATRVRFSRAGEAKLLKAIDIYGTDDWETIAEQIFDNRYTPQQLRRKFISVKHWTQARENLLMKSVPPVVQDSEDIRNDSVWQAAADEIEVKEGVRYTLEECRSKWLDVMQRQGRRPDEWGSPWSAQEIDAFWEQWKLHGQNWDVIADQLGRRTADECRHKFSYLFKDVSKKGPKDPDELEALRVYFSTSSPGRVYWNTEMQDRLTAAVDAWRELSKGERINWKWVARRVDIPGVTGDKCFHRWSNYHLKDLRRPNSMGFSQDEDQRLLKAAADYQHRIWVELTQRGLFPDRSAEALQARWNEIRDSLMRVGSQKRGTKTTENVQDYVAKMVEQQFRVATASEIPMGLLPSQDELLRHHAELSASPLSTLVDDDQQLALDRGVKRIWTEEESQQLNALLAKYGRSTIAWQFIAQILGTTPERCKSRWRRQQ